MQVIFPFLVVTQSGLHFFEARFFLFSALQIIFLFFLQENNL